MALCSCTTARAEPPVVGPRGAGHRPRPANGNSDMHGAPSRADREAAGRRRLLLCTLASPGQQEARSRNAAAAAKGPILSDPPPGQQAGRRPRRVIMSARCAAAVPVPVRAAELTGIVVAGRWIHAHVHVHGGVRMLARGTSPASSSAGEGP
jgi:hypothetical protein